MNAPRCNHLDREPNGDGTFTCQRCGWVFRPRAKRTLHGTPSGYEKHKKTRKGEWDWPACDRCRQARAAYLEEYGKRPQVSEAEAKRRIARNRAMFRLKQRYPVDYAKFFAEELMLLDETGGAIERLEQEVGILLRGVSARTGNFDLRGAETLLRRAVTGRYASPAEREVWARIVQIRARIGELNGTREPDGDR